NLLKRKVARATNFDTERARRRRLDPLRRARYAAPMRARRVWLLAFLPFLVAAGGRPYHNDAMKVRGFEAPIGWEPQPVGSYARLLAAWETRDGGRLTLVAQKVKPGTTAASLVAESRPALERQRFRDIKLSPAPPAGDDSDRVVLDAIVDDGHQLMRQLYAVAGDT